MIVPMKKLYLLCMQQYTEEALNKLAELGAVHISAPVTEDSEEISTSRSAIDEAKRALNLISAAHSTNKDSGSLLLNSAKAETGSHLVKSTLLVETRIKELHERLAVCEAEKKDIEPFGAFEPKHISELAEKGFLIKLLSLPVKAEPILPDSVSLFEISRSDGQKYMAAVSKSEFRIEHAREFPIPSRSLGAVLLQIESCKAEIDVARAEIAQMARQLSVVERYIKGLEETRMFAEARAALSRDGKVTYLQGFCPAEATDKVLDYAKRHGWGVLIQEPESDEMVPTLITSPAWVRPIKSLFDMIDVLPGYREVDASSLFLLFFSIFFAILVGDAGYGIIFLILTVLLRLKFRQASPEPFRLLGILSICTIIWGTITANFFGTGPSMLSSLTIDWLLKERNFISFCFFMGAVHLTIAHSWNVIRSINSTRALSQLGWVGLTWSMFFGARFLVLDYPLPFWYKFLFIPALILVVLFKTPFKKLKTEWTGHIMLPFDVIGNFVDVVSYVRLFAVGGASLAVALAFNEIAMGIGFHGIASSIVASLILFIGHGLNIILSVMSVLVHGVRLNTLEFSGHLGLEWSGFRYKPFAREKYGSKS